MAGLAWVNNTSGGFFANPQLSDELRNAASPIMRFRQFVRSEPKPGKNKGDTVNFDRIGRIATLGTTVSELDTIPEQSASISQGTLTVNEYGVATPYTGKLEALSQFPVENVAITTLRLNMAMSIDKLIADEFKKAKLTGVATAGDALVIRTDGTFANAATVNVGVFHLKEGVDRLKTPTNCPPYDGSDYICIASTKALRGLKDDGEYKTAAQYGDPSLLFDGEIGRLYGTRFIETTHTNALSNGVGTANIWGEMVLFGSDPVIEAVTIAPEIRVDIPKDFGRSKRVAWYSMMGWSIVWDTAGAPDGEARILYYGSS